MNPCLERIRHWLPPAAAGFCVALVGRMIFWVLKSPQATLAAATWPGIFLLALAYGLFRRANWARWIAALLCFLAGVFCFVLLVSRFFPPGLFGRDGATAVVERPSLGATLAWLLPPSLLLPTIAHLLRPARNLKQ